jgi:hypothetical protein
MGFEEGERAGEEGAGAFFALVGQELGIGEAGSVIDGDVQVLPADVARAAGEIAVDGMADAPDAAELLGVDVDQFAGLSRS